MNATTPDLKKLFKNSINNIKNILFEKRVPFELIYGVPYNWDTSYIDQEIFNEINLNDKLKYENFKESLNQSLLSKREERTNKKSKKKELKELKSKLDEEKQYFSSLILDGLENIWFSSKDTKYIIHSGPTNSGKTYNAILSLISSKNGIYLAPLRLLAWEIYEKIKNVYNKECNLLTGEERIYDEDVPYTSSTIEMCDYKKHYDVMVIDESFMISDDQRGKAWTRAILESNADTIHIISSSDSLWLIEEILIKTHKNYEINEYERKVPLVISDRPTQIKDILPKSVFVVFSRTKAIQLKSFLEKGKTKVSILYGALPPETKKQQMELFSKGKTDICVSTDVIGMGVNLPCDNIIFTEIKKFDGTNFRELLSFEVKQIGGRAGRYGLSDKGTIWATDKQDIKFLKENFEKNEHNKIAYCEINFDVLKLIDKPTLKEKIQFYSKLNFIPNILNKIMYLEDTKFLLELSSYSSIEKIDMDISWQLIRLPVSDSNIEIWRSFCDKISKKEKFNIPPFILEEPIKILDQNQLKMVEELISGIDLISNIYNNRTLKQFLVSDIDIEKIKEIKYKYIEFIDDFLVNKNAFKKKKCLECSTELPIESYHKLCDKCYFESNN